MNIFLAKSLCYRGASQEAQPLLAQARELQSAPTLKRMLPYVQQVEALCLLAQGQQRAALGKLEQAVANSKQIPPGQISVVVMHELMLAEVLHHLGETGRAGRLKAEALARLDNIDYAANAPLRHQPLLPPVLLPH
jgi:tetratricopeptide (TPR) repeat protein